MKRRHVDSTLVTCLPHDTLLHVFEYVLAVDLHFSIPFVCQYFRDCLQTRWAALEITSGVPELDKRSCTNSNLLWKSLLSYQCPSIDIVTSYHLYDFHKLYYHKFDMKVPAYAHQHKIQQMIELTLFWDKSLHETLAISKQNDIKEFKETFKTLNERFQEISTIMYSIDAHTIDNVYYFQTGGMSSKSHLSETIEPGPFYDKVGEFMNQTIKWEQHITLAPSYDGYHRIHHDYLASVLLRSPINGKSARVDINASQFMNTDPIPCKIPNEQFFASPLVKLYDLDDKETVLSFGEDEEDAADTLWKTAVHLGLDYLVCNKSVFLQEFWGFISEYVLYAEDSEFENYFFFVNNTIRKKIRNQVT